MQKDLGYAGLLNQFTLGMAGIDSREKIADKPYKEVPIPEHMWPAYKKAGYNVKEGDTMPQGMLPSQAATGLGGMLNIAAYEGAGTKQAQKTAADIAAGGVPVPQHDPTGEATKELGDTGFWGNMDESAIIDIFDEYIGKLDTGGWTEGGPTVWNKAMSSLGEYGKNQYGYMLISEIEKMYEGIGKSGMDSLSPHYNKKRKSVQRDLESKLKQLYKQSGKFPHTYMDNGVETTITLNDYLKTMQQNWDSSYKTIK